MSTRSIAYSVSVGSASQHLLHVTLTVRGDLPEPLNLEMPVWTPGSYLVREYSRHVQSLRAESATGPVGVRKVSKNRWAIAHGGADRLTIDYEVYAHDLTVRTNHVSDSHAYWNGAATYVRPVEADGSWDRLPVEVRVVRPHALWSVATSLEPVVPAPDGAPSDVSVFRARDFDDLVDCPIDVGRHERLEFTVRDKPHAIVLWGARARFDRERLVRDVRAIVEAEAEFFGGLPYDHYLFLMHLAKGGRGGLEHCTSCSLLVSPESIETPEGYDDVLSLFAHEFFHLWQIKRTKPEGLVPFDYGRENYTRMLWLFEGGTSYYDWLLIRRAGLVDARSYLKHLASEIARLEETPGREVQSLEDASFDAWIKLYRPDENSSNSTVSYYLKGEVVCALLDLEIRVRSKGARSLDDVLRHLWREYGSTGRGVPESSIEAVIAAATDVDVADLIDTLVRSTSALPYDRVFAHAGLSMRARPGRGTALGVRLRNDNGRVMIASVLRGSAAERGGLAAGDEIIAVDGRRVDESSLREQLKHREPEEKIDVMYSRRDEIGSTTLALAASPPDGYEFTANVDASAAARSLAGEWLGTGAEALWSAR